MSSLVHVFKKRGDLAEEASVSDETRTTVWFPAPEKTLEVKCKEGMRKQVKKIPMEK